MRRSPNGRFETVPRAARGQCLPDPCSRGRAHPCRVHRCNGSGRGDGLDRSCGKRRPGRRQRAPSSGLRPRTTAEGPFLSRSEPRRSRTTSRKSRRSWWLCGALPRRAAGCIVAWPLHAVDCARRTCTPRRAILSDLRRLGAPLDPPARADGLDVAGTIHRAALAIVSLYLPVGRTPRPGGSRTSGAGSIEAESHTRLRFDREFPLYIKHLEQSDATRSGCRAIRSRRDPLWGRGPDDGLRQVADRDAPRAGKNCMGRKLRSCAFKRLNDCRRLHASAKLRAVGSPGTLRR